MSLLQPKIKCEPHALMHGDEVKMGDTVLSFHIHPGTDTCDGCEPGQVMAHLSKYKREEKTGEPTLMSPSGENCMKSLICFFTVETFPLKKPHDSIRFRFFSSQFDSISIQFNIDLNASISIQ